jgi:glycosyltransferase involved in cell wall biosynthesis
MAAGLSCVVSDILPNRELVDPDYKFGELEPGGYAVCECGILFRSGDSVGLAEAFRFLCKNKEIREKIGKSARARAIGDFSMKRVEEGYMKLYRGLYEKEGK